MECSRDYAVDFDSGQSGDQSYGILFYPGAFSKADGRYCKYDVISSGGSDLFWDRLCDIKE